MFWYKIYKKVIWPKIEKKNKKEFVLLVIEEKKTRLAHVLCLQIKLVWPQSWNNPQGLFS